jgi:O-antigen/teichoic acid export membrane protein
VAVRAETTGGAAAAREQMSRNIGILFAVILPSVAGCWLVLPSFEHLVIPPAFHGSFSHYFTLILPAMLCFALTQYCVGPAFQIVHRTMPLIIGGIVSASANGLALLLLPTSADASSFALAQSIGGCASLATMVAFLVTLEPMWPRPRDIAGALVGTAAMVLAVAPLRAMCPCVPTLALTAAAGFGVYMLAILAFDVGGLRTLLGDRYRVWSAARQTGAGTSATAG